MGSRPDISCSQKISDFSVCNDKNQTEIMITKNYCLRVDHLGRTVDIHQDADYSYKCIGFFKENSKSYLITYDDLNSFSVSWLNVLYTLLYISGIDITTLEKNLFQKYRCWIYQLTDLNRVLISQSVDAVCNIKQNVTSWNYTEGATVALDMNKYEIGRAYIFSYSV